MKKILCATMLASTVALSGCATIFSKSTYPVAINSDPTGATFTIKNRDGAIVTQGTTPQIVELKAGAGYFKRGIYTITFQKPGFADREITVSSSIDGWYFGNIAIGGVLGMIIIDPATGAMYKLPDKAQATLSPSTTPSLTVVDINKVPAKERAKLKRIK